MMVTKWACTLILLAFLSFGHIDSYAYVTSDDIQSRLARLETRTDLKFAEMEKALVLARDLAERDREVATTTLNNRLESMNEFRAQINKAEATYATKDAVDARIKEIERLVYIGVGLLLALQFLVVFYGKRNNVLK